MKVLLCIDDTDNIDSIGTGELLENMCGELERRGLGRGGFVTRHQLFISDKIAYTSHNSSMCCQVETEDFDALAAFAGEYLDRGCAEGSDPGLCVFKCDEEGDVESLLDFGRRAKEEVLSKKEAYDLAKSYSGRLHLSQHGGTGDGVIGALAGVGLRLTGNDGKVKGKIKPDAPGEILTVARMLEKFGLGQIKSEDGSVAGAEELVRFDAVTKAVFLDNMVTVLAEKRDGYWIPKPKANKVKK